MLGASDTVNKKDSHPCPLGVYSPVGRQAIHSKANEFNNTGQSSAMKARGEWAGRGQPHRMVRKGSSGEMKVKLRPGGQESAALERAFQADKEQGHVSRWASACPVQGWSVTKVGGHKAAPRR